MRQTNSLPAAKISPRRRKKIPCGCAKNSLLTTALSAHGLSNIKALSRNSGPPEEKFLARREFGPFGRAAIMMGR